MSKVSKGKMTGRSRGARAASARAARRSDPARFARVQARAVRRGIVPF